jgi:hypothetical protein
VSHRLKGLSAKVKDIHTELAEMLRSDAIVYSTVTKYMRKEAILQNEPEAEDRAENQGFSIPDNAILEALEMMSFASIRQIATKSFIPPATTFRRLTKSLRLVLKRLRSVAHRLSDLQKQDQSIVSKELLKLLEFMRHHSWKCVVRLDEAWFDLSIFLLITNQFGSVQNVKLPKGRVISEGDADDRLEPTRISCG